MRPSDRRPCPARPTGWSWLFPRLLAALGLLGVLLPARGAGPAGPGEDSWLDPQRLHLVRLQVATNEWEQLRQERNSILQALGPQRTNGGRPRAYRNHPGTVAFGSNGIPVAVTVRKKGFIGSVSSTRPSLNLLFRGAPAPDPLRDFSKLTLNNNQQDPSASHQSLVYALFRAAGVPAPRTALARVEVNGRSLGIYTVVEPVDDRFLRRHFGEGAGALWEGTLADFRPGWTETLEPKNTPPPEAGAALAELTAALALPDDQLLPALEKRLEIDAFLRFWAVEVLVDHWDGYVSNGNNFFVHLDRRTGRFSFIPWGADQCFGLPNPVTGRGTPASVRASSQIARRLYQHPETRERYRAVLRQLLDTVWKEAELLAQLDEIGRLVAEDPEREGARKNVRRRTREFIERRRAALRRELDGPAPEWKQPPRRAPHLENWGRIEARFATEYRPRGPEALAGDPPGEGNLQLVHEGRTNAFPRLAATAGRSLDPGQTDQAWVYLLVMQGLGRVIVPALGIPRERFQPGAVLAVGGEGVDGFLFDGMPGGGGGFGFLEGELRLEAAGLNPGDPVRGTVNATIWRFPMP